MDYVPYTPHRAPLAGRVELLFVLSGYAPEHRRERIVPNGRTNLVIELDGRPRFVYDNDSGEPRQECREAWLSGVHSAYITIGETVPSSRLAVVQFMPGGARPFLPRDLDAYCDRVVPAGQVFGTGMSELRRALLAAPSSAEILERLDAWLTARFDAASAAPPIVPDIVTRLLDAAGDIKLTDAVAEHGTVSYKHFVDLFRRHVGPTPKRMQRILRFAQVFEHVQGGAQVDWAALSLELGYADQAHFAREFRRFSGYRPSTFAGQGHDRVNFFPEEETR